MNPHQTFCNSRRGGVMCDCRCKWNFNTEPLPEWEQDLLTGTTKQERALENLRVATLAARRAGLEVEVKVTEKKEHRL